MGDSAFWYSPHSNPLVVPTQKVSLGETISDLQLTPYRISHDAVSWGGKLSRVNFRTGLRVRIINERFTDNELSEKLYTMNDHLERGGGVSFAVDDTKTFCGFGEKAHGGFELTGTAAYDLSVGPLFTSYSSTAPASGDVLIAQSFGPDAKREEVRVHSYSGRRLTLASKLKFDHKGTILFRHRDFFPALFRPAASNETALLTHDHRITWTWDATLEEYPAHVRKMAEASASAVESSPLDDLISGPEKESEAGVLGAIDGLSSTGIKKADLPPWFGE